MRKENTQHYARVFLEHKGIDDIIINKEYGKGKGLLLSTLLSQFATKSENNEKKFFYYYYDLLKIANDLGYETVESALINEYQKHKSCLPVSKMFKITKHTVQKHLNRLGVKLNKVGGNYSKVYQAKTMAKINPVLEKYEIETLDELFKKLFLDGQTTNEIIRDTGLSKYIVIHHLKRLNLLRTQAEAQAIRKNKKYSKILKLFPEYSDINSLCSELHVKYGSYRKVGTLLGIGDNTVKRLIIEKEIKP